ncbi:four helix bundle protein [Candidatus Uhrbacteria bacterium]|nr:four helix bundle protein [Candidatus Uhrbacteria bacterium]MBD3283944.1 four helix bundle protein [Candidatus Uhrbacteria bacterium]
MKGYQTLLVWQKSFELVEKIYVATNTFPKEERYGLTSQIRRAAISIPSNIAEGYRRKHPKVWKEFTLISYGSASELETQLLLAHKLSYLSDASFQELMELLNHVLRLLNGFLTYITTHYVPRTTH